MRQTTASTLTLKGSPKEIGQQLATYLTSMPAILEGYLAMPSPKTPLDLDYLFKLYDLYCPGLKEETIAFSEALGIEPAALPFNRFSLLTPGCSQLAVQSHRNETGDTLLFRNYDFSDQMDDMTLIKTIPQKGYTHLATSVVLMGRADGINEEGLAVSFSACGMPVGHEPFMRKPNDTGLQFWVIIRGLLEQCATVDEALALLKDCPVQSNINLILTDATDHIALYECFDRHVSVKHMTPNDDKGFITATNHIHLAELKPLQPGGMVNSFQRESLIDKLFDQGTTPDLKALNTTFQSKYPEGLATGYYREGFGTLRTMRMNSSQRTLEMCFGSPLNNDFKAYRVTDDLPNAQMAVHLPDELVDPSFFAIR